MNNVDFDIDLTIILREIGRYVCRIYPIRLYWAALQRHYTAHAIPGWLWWLTSCISCTLQYEGSKHRRLIASIIADGGRAAYRSLYAFMTSAV